MTEFAERPHHVRFCFPVLRFQLLREVLVEGGRTCAVEEYQDFEFLFHAIFVLFVIPSVVENGAAGEAATSTGRLKAERTGSERIKSLIVVSLVNPEMSRLRST